MKVTFLKNMVNIILLQSVLEKKLVQEDKGTKGWYVPISLENVKFSLYVKQKSGVKNLH